MNSPGSPSPVGANIIRRRTIAQRHVRNLERARESTLTVDAENRRGRGARLAAASREDLAEFRDREARAKQTLQRAEAIYLRVFMVSWVVFASMICLALGSLILGLVVSQFSGGPPPNWVDKPITFGVVGLVITAIVLIAFHIVVKFWERRFHRWAAAQSIDLSNWREDEPVGTSGGG